MSTIDVCETPDILRVIYFIKIIIDIIKIVIPIALIILISIDCASGVIKENVEFKVTFKRNINKMIAAILIFALPTIVNIFLEVMNTSTDYVSCWTNANSEKIEEYQIAYDEEKQESSILSGLESFETTMQEGTQNMLENAETTIQNFANGSKTPIVNGVQRPLETGDCMSFDDNCYCPSIGRFSGFAFTMQDETGRYMAEVAGWGDELTQVTVSCIDGTTYSSTVNSKVAENFEQAYKKICLLQTVGVMRTSGFKMQHIKLNKSNIQLDGTYVIRTTSSRQICSPHAYGIGIDINYALNITVNGTTYKPYSGQGVSTKREYDAFVGAIGSEDNILNVNYILWKYAFEPSGFTWGGNWSDSAFDPMHYEVSS